MADDPLIAPVGDAADPRPGDSEGGRGTQPFGSEGSAVAGASPPAEPGAPADPSGAGPSLDDLVGRLADLTDEVARFRQRAEHRETIIDRLHAENQELREGLRGALFAPLVTDLARLYDGLARDAARLEADDAPSGTAALLRSYADDVVLALERCDIEVFAAEPGHPFESGRYRPVAIVSCADPEWHNTVAEPVAAGLCEMTTGRVRRPAKARFYQHTAPDTGGGGEPGTDGANIDRPIQQSPGALVEQRSEFPSAESPGAANHPEQ